MRGHNHSKCQWRTRGPIHYDPTSQRRCCGWTNGDFLGDGGGLGPAQLPVAEERNRYQRGDFFAVYDSAHHGFRQSRALYGSRYQ
jgi:hypothetical protein